jgi:hypothetical protein
MNDRTVRAALVLMMLTAEPVCGAPTAALPPSPPADARIIVKYPPVPIAGTAWEKTVAQRQAASRRAQQRAGSRQKTARPAAAGRRGPPGTGQGDDPSRGAVKTTPASPRAR